MSAHLWVYYVDSDGNVNNAAKVKDNELTSDYIVVVNRPSASYTGPVYLVKNDHNASEAVVGDSEGMTVGQCYERLPDSDPDTYVVTTQMPSGKTLSNGHLGTGSG